MDELHGEPFTSLNTILKNNNFFLFYTRTFKVFFVNTIVLFHDEIILKFSFLLLGCIR